ncbi:MAG: hypothetical protein GXP29_10240, partial [Planctomycetes bacterium]|nr:hypothetical protein [Planctomycetota bacterium]
MFCAFQIAAVLAMSTGLDESGGAKMNPAVAAAIGSFAPFWAPPKHSLSGVTIVIHPVGGGATSSPQRTCDDNSLLTASFLRHFIKQAGGSAIVTRLGDGPSVFDQADSISPLEFARDADRAAYISIGFDRDSKQTVVRFETADASTKTADRFRQFLTSTMEPDGINVEKVSDLRNRLVKEAGAASDLAAVAQSVCQVVFVCPERGNRREQRDRMHCRKLARSLCEGFIQSFEGSVTQSGADQSVVDVVGLDRARGTARKLWPQGDLPPDKLNWFIELYTALSGSSGSFTYFDISIEKVGEGYSVVGSTNAPGVVDGLLAGLHEVGVRDVQSNFRALPDRERLGGMIHGVCTASAFRTYSCPNPADGLIHCGEQTQLLYGEPVYLLDRDEKSLLVQAA